MAAWQAVQTDICVLCGTAQGNLQDETGTWHCLSCWEAHCGAVADSRGANSISPPPFVPKKVDLLDPRNSDTTSHGSPASEQVNYPVMRAFDPRVHLFSSKSDATVLDVLSDWADWGEEGPEAVMVAQTPPKGTLQSGRGGHGGLDGRGGGGGMKEEGSRGGSLASLGGSGASSSGGPTTTPKKKRNRHRRKAPDGSSALPSSPP